ncbi:MAG: serine/threonine protein kinase [Labilithrix sp.]|nr:serine/threonine protein kinase [Labilithrix sp.]
MGSFTPPPATALAPGDRLDRYELLCVLAQGGMGTVWLARLTGKHGFERLVALKTILPTYGNDRQFSDMFLDEARIAAQIDHENVARILEIGEDRGALYHAMELIDGESLRKLYRDIRAVGAPFPLAVALRIAADVCAGLHAVHELRGPDGVSLDVVHRDVSPQNILLNVRGTIKLIDFGVAKARERRTEDTTAGTLKGKIEYMAPEQARGDRIDRRADVYAVGAVLYELLSGEPVRSTEEGRQLLALHELMTGAPYEPLHHSVPLPVRSLVDRALSRDPELRYRTTEDMRHALEQAMVTIGHVATSDDVANVLTHFSRERTQRRKDAIEAALRVAQSLEKEKSAPGAPSVSRASVHTVVAPLQVPSSPRPVQGQLLVGPKGTQVIGVTGPVVGEGPGTGPSMRTMQGASMSGLPPPPRSGMSAAKVFGALLVLGLVGVLGVVGGVVVSRNGMVAGVEIPGVPAASTSTAAPPAVADDAGASIAAPPVALDPSGGVVLGAGDAGVATAAASSASSAAPASSGAHASHASSASSAKAGKKTGGKAGARSNGSKPEGDEYGF